jgi:probable HAF family extracellular repeat protein
MGKRYLFLLCLVLGVLLFLSGTTEARKYRYTDLGTFGGQQTLQGEGEAWGLNDKGQIVGWAGVVVGQTWEPRAVRWDTATRTFIDLGAGNDSCALGINNLGWIVGTASLSNARAFFWDPASPTPQILPNNLGGTQSWANKINDQGQVVGYAETSEAGYVHAFLSDWTNRTMQDLNTLGGNESWGNDINSLGQIVGTAQIDTGMQLAFLDPGNRVLQNLETLDGDESAAMGINNQGQVVGWSTASDGVYAFLRNILAPGEPMQNLGILTGEYNYSQALSINDRGEVVGECGYINMEGIVESRGAFLWTATKGMQDLNTLVVNLPTGFSLACAYGINRGGWIVGVAYTNDSQGLHQRAFLLRPIADLAHLNLLLLD